MKICLDISKDAALWIPAVYGILAAIVKACPTLPANHWILPVIKILGRLTNNQTDDEAGRKADSAGGTK